MVRLSEQRTRLRFCLASAACIVTETWGLLTWSVTRTHAGSLSSNFWVISDAHSLDNRSEKRIRLRFALLLLPALVTAAWGVLT